MNKTVKKATGAAVVNDDFIPHFSPSNKSYLFFFRWILFFGDAVAQIRSVARWGDAPLFCLGRRRVVVALDRGRRCRTAGPTSHRLTSG